MIAEITFLPMLGQILSDDLYLSIFAVLAKLAGVMFSLLFWLGSTAGIIYLIHFLLSLPMRRAERARLFLYLVEGALQRKQSVEKTILSLAQSQDQSMGVRFHVLAAYIEGGLKLSEALEKVPRFLPPQIMAMLCAGEKLGNLENILPACHEILRDRPATIRSAVHYMLLMVLFYSPGAIFIIMAMMTFVVPKFKEVAAGFGIAVWPFSQFVFANAFVFVGVEAFIGLSLITALLMYVGGSRFVRWFQFRGLPFVDWIAWHIPWKQKRLQRTFSAMLAVLLDGGVPEAEAVRLAGEATANDICCRRAQRVIAALAKGIKLDEAIRTFDDSGEFHWRFTNAAHAHGGFLNALRGWHASLEARAFQQEEATAHIVTSGLVILNGLVVALIAIGMFGMLVFMLKGVLAST
jgi:type II secretory pathway component PulF